jgi:predicted GIY-YIG superfamily endonuclease
MAIEKRVHYADKDKAWPTGLKTAQQVSDSIGIDVDRLLEFANSHHIPHWRIEHGEPLFQLSEVKKWCAENLLNRVEGAELSVHLRLMVDPPIAKEAPEAIREITGLRDISAFLCPPGVYMLVHNSEVVYVGQSVSPAARIATHIQGDKIFDNAYLVPVPSQQLDEVEGAIIRELKPKYNFTERGILLAPGRKDIDDEVLERYAVK